MGACSGMWAHVCGCVRVFARLWEHVYERASVGACTCVGACVVRVCMCACVWAFLCVYVCGCVGVSGRVVYLCLHVW